MCKAVEGAVMDGFKLPSVGDPEELRARLRGIINADHDGVPIVQPME